MLGVALFHNPAVGEVMRETAAELDVVDVAALPALLFLSQVVDIHCCWSVNVLSDML